MDSRPQKYILARIDDHYVVLEWIESTQFYVFFSNVGDLLNNARLIVDKLNQ